MIRRAIILAGGKGTRLRPYTVVLPKPLMPIGDYPILEVVIRQLASHGFEHITLAVNHQAEIIKAFFGDGNKWGLKIDYSLENTPLGTIGPLKNIRDLPDNFLVMNGDILTDLNFSQFIEEHLSNNSLFTISSHTRSEKIDYGVLNKDAEGRLIGFDEKPRKSYEVSMGIYAANISILNYISKQPYGFDNLMLDLLAANKPVHVRRFNGYWLDIGRPDDYLKAIEEFDTMRSTFLND